MQNKWRLYQFETCLDIEWHRLIKCFISQSARMTAKAYMLIDNKIIIHKIYFSHETEFQWKRFVNCQYHRYRNYDEDTTPFTRKICNFTYLLQNPKKRRNERTWARINIYLILEKSSFSDSDSNSLVNWLWKTQRTERAFDFMCNDEKQGTTRYYNSIIPTCMYRIVSLMVWVQGKQNNKYVGTSLVNCCEWSSIIIIRQRKKSRWSVFCDWIRLDECRKMNI